MKLLRNNTFVTFIALCMMSLATASQMKLNYHSDHYCNNWKEDLHVSWADSMTNVNAANCYNYQTPGSVRISDCYAGSFCMCKFYYQSNCQGSINDGYASLQFNSYGDTKKRFEYNCLFNSGSFKSFRCYIY